MKDNHIKVEGYPNLVRDLESGALLNMDHEKVRQINLRKKNRALLKIKEDATEERIHTIENDINEIKTMLSTLLKSYK